MYVNFSSSGSVGIEDMGSVLDELEGLGKPSQILLLVDRYIYLIGNIFLYVSHHYLDPLLFAFSVLFISCI